MMVMMLKFPWEPTITLIIYVPSTNWKRYTIYLLPNYVPTLHLNRAKSLNCSAQKYMYIKPNLIARSKIGFDKKSRAVYCGVVDWGNYGWILPSLSFIYNKLWKTRNFTCLLMNRYTRCSSSQLRPCTSPSIFSTDFWLFLQWKRRDWFWLEWPLYNWLLNMQE